MKYAGIFSSNEERAYYFWSNNFNRIEFETVSMYLYFIGF